MPQLFRLIRQASRRLARTPGFTGIAVVTLALGIGATTAIFTVVDAVLVRPLPYPESERLVGLWHVAPGLGFDRVNMSPAAYFTYRDEGTATVFEDVAIYSGQEAAVTGLEEPEQVRAMLVTDGFFPLLRVAPHIGRFFSREDDQFGAPATVVLGYGYWQSRFGGDASAIGKTLTVEGRPRQIIGVAPEHFRFFRTETAIWFPPQWDRSRVFMGNFSYESIARLRPGASIEQAEAEITRLIPLATERFPGGVPLEMLVNAQFGPDVHSLKEDIVGDVGEVLWVLLGTVGLVLLIACANVANLFLVRAEGRYREVAVRTAMGAGRGHVARQFLGESMSLALLGGLGGVALAYGGVRLLVSLGPSQLPRLSEIALNARALSFAVVLSLVAGLLIGLLPALRMRDVGLVAALKEGGRGGGAGRERHRLRHALVVGQVALALVLLVGSGLMIRSFLALRQVDPGFEGPEEVLTFRIAVPSAEVEDFEGVVAVHEAITERLRAIPGVVSVGASSSITMDGWNSSDPIYVEDHPTPEGQLPPIHRFKWIAPGFFETLGNPILAGRSMTWADIHSKARVVVVTENFAREHWGDPAMAIGKRIRNPRLVEGGVTWREIIGVAADVHDDGLDQPETSVVYWPFVIEEFWEAGTFVQRSLAFAVRTVRPDPKSLLPEVREAVWSVNRNLPLARVKTLQEIVDDSLARTSFTLVMLGIASGVALVLGMVGIYGVISYLVSQRTREIGVRMALGARRADVSGMMVRYGILLTGGGIVLGLAAAFGLTRWMSALLFGIEATDPLTFAAVAAVLAVVALLASLGAALRAAGVDPTEALRAE
ncbi:MAG TPA: ABC transporter permease [Thermoanaerobaculia bacterium]|nr:ABC transporter permease [Thermoanaerobaculia bacterium]